MTELQTTMAILGGILALNFCIALLYKKYVSMKELELSVEKEKTLELSNRTSIVSNQFGGALSIMPRVPWLILYHSKTTKLKQIITIHNILCICVYGLFILAIAR